MARVIQVRVWCDVCQADGEAEVEATEVTVATAELGLGKPRMLALCEGHREAYYEPLARLLAELGQRPDAEPKRGPGRPPRVEQPPLPVTDELTCTECGHVAPTISALGSHVRNAHDKTLDEYRGMTLTFKCPDCGRAFARAQSFGAHRARAHGVAGKSQQSIKARERKAG